ncbi:MAG TPA: beta-galactosidase [Capsulimonadaceae bacterium]
MSTFKIDNVSYSINGERVFLYSGEFHYFRVPKKDWRKRLDLWKEAGGNCVATYIPWVVHELSEGDIRFGDESYRDLEGFIEVVKEAGLFLIARPGPYSYTELINSGLPTWLVNDYPNILAKRIDGSLIASDAVSYLHPQFLDRVATWYDAVCPLIAKNTINRGGPIIMTQFDNELCGVQVWRGSMDYNPEAMGFGSEDGRFASWLAKRYESVSELNEAHEALYASFGQAKPLSDAAEGSCGRLRSKRDYFDFYTHTISEYALWLTRAMRERDIDTNFVHNSGNPGMNSFFVEMCRALGDNFLLGSDHYYNLDQTWSQNSPTPQWAIGMFQSSETLRLMGYPPTVFELPGGSLSDWPPITAHDVKACTMTNIALGVKGVNYYIFTGGPNPPGTGWTADDYDYGAAISSGGEIRALYHAEKEVGLFLRENQWLAHAHQATDFAVGLDFEQARAENYGSSTDIQVSGSDAYQFLRTGVLTTAFCAGWSPTFVDLSAREWMSDQSLPIYIAGADSMSRDTQHRLVEFLRSGGKIVIGPVLPTLDERFTKCTLLSEFLGVGPSEKATGPVRLTFADLANVSNTGTVYFPKSAPDESEVLGVDEFSGRPVAWSRKFSSGGEAIILGFRWLHGKREHCAMLSKLLLHLGSKKIIRSSNPNVWCVVRTTGQKSMLFALNLSSSDMETEVEIDIGPNSDVISLGKLLVESGSVLTVGL